MFWAYGVQCIGYCSGFYTLSLPTYIFWLEIFSNTSIAHMWCGNVLGLWGSTHWFLQWFLHLKPPNLHFLVGNLQQYIYCICDVAMFWAYGVQCIYCLPYVMWQCFGLMGFNLKPPNLHFLVGNLQQYIYCPYVMWQCFVLMGFNALVIAVVSTP